MIRAQGGTDRKFFLFFVVSNILIMLWISPLYYFQVLILRQLFSSRFFRSQNKQLGELARFTIIYTSLDN